MGGKSSYQPERGFVVRQMGGPTWGPPRLCHACFGLPQPRGLVLGGNFFPPAPRFRCLNPTPRNSRSPPGLTQGEPGACKSPTAFGGRHVSLGHPGYSQGLLGPQRGNLDPARAKWWFPRGFPGVAKSGEFPFPAALPPGHRRPQFFRGARPRGFSGTWGYAAQGSRLRSQEASAPGKPTQEAPPAGTIKSTLVGPQRKQDRVSRDPSPRFCASKGLTGYLPGARFGQEFSQGTSFPAVSKEDPRKDYQDYATPDDEPLVPTGDSTRWCNLQYRRLCIGQPKLECLATYSSCDEGPFANIWISRSTRGAAADIAAHWPGPDVSERCVYRAIRKTLLPQ